MTDIVERLKEINGIFIKPKGGIQERVDNARALDAIDEIERLRDGCNDLADKINLIEALSQDQHDQLVGAAAKARALSRPLSPDPEDATTDLSCGP